MTSVEIFDGWLYAHHLKKKMDNVSICSPLPTRCWRYSFQFCFISYFRYFCNDKNWWHLGVFEFQLFKSKYLCVTLMYIYGPRTSTICRAETFCMCCVRIRVFCWWRGMQGGKDEGRIILTSPWSFNRYLAEEKNIRVEPNFKYIYSCIV